MDVPSFDDVLAAQRRIAGRVHRTPVLTSASLDGLVGSRVHCKAEHLQGSGAFKLRGATNAVWSLSDEEAARGVAAHSSGNHANALARAARSRGIPCWIVMPRTAPEIKLSATRDAGAEVVLCEPTLADREVQLATVLARTGAVEVHPFDDVRVIAGQGTACLELLDEVPSIGLVVTPISGGGLLSGSAIAAHGVDPAIQVWGAEPLGADDAFRSLAAGRIVTDVVPRTIADGLHAQLSERTFSILTAHGVRIVTVTEDEIVAAMGLLFERLKQVVEPSGAVPLAGLLALRRDGVDLPEDVGIVLSGGNVDLATLPFS